MAAVSQMRQEKGEQVSIVRKPTRKKWIELSHDEREALSAAIVINNPILPQIAEGLKESGIATQSQAELFINHVAHNAARQDHERSRR